MIIDLTNNRFGKYTVISQAPPRKGSNNRSSGAQWLCRCDCGKLMSHDGHHLRIGRVTGCKNCTDTLFQWKGYGDISHTYWCVIKSRCVLKRRQFTVTIEEAWQIFLAQGKKCALSGIPLEFAKRYISKLSSAQTASLDRIDSSLGYTKDNVQWLHKRINVMKSNLPTDEFINWCKLVAKHNE